MPATANAFAAALSTTADTRQAAKETTDAVRQQLATPPDLLVVFATHHHGPDFAPLVQLLNTALEPKHLIGCTADTVLATQREAEEQPGLAVWAATLPETQLVPMHLEFQRTADGGTFVGWPEELPAAWPADAALLMLAEPFSFPADALLEPLSESHPGVPVMGGMASGMFQPGANQVFMRDKVFSQGAVGVYVQGGVRIRSVVSQGCRPVGRPLVVTKAERNLIQRLGGQPALERLQEIFNELSPEDQQLVNQGVHLGRVIDERRDHFERGDFLVRNCLGADQESGAIAIGDWVRMGQTVQFHVRDARTADDDLRELLAAAARDFQPQAALMFTCNGRGTRLFDEPNHDAGALADQFGPIPTAGYFAQGEIGPIGGRNFLHGFTASVALFG